MVETITPAVCGSRKRQLVALVLFALGAVAASAALGAVLGFAGSAIGAGPRSSSRSRSRRSAR